MRHYHVECVCTTDDPVDDLHWHKVTRESGFEIKMLPAWRPDKAMNIEHPDFSAYMDRLSEVSGIEVDSYQHLIDALQRRHDFFMRMDAVSRIMALRSSIVSRILLLRSKQFLVKHCVACGSQPWRCISISMLS